ncbi:hypothetical protein [Flavobacterium luteum]|uniref:Uncharacterized protein n=1 Tax=Flavobacterium luteum TaxID=2026654 RepID=A0A7J5AH17_9FLAO|nr:hypothetical protein [Flavobacterium luteum]KAB1156884.1 hypothetical protein F6464_05900 [Flavobacterium luteum]
MEVENVDNRNGGNSKGNGGNSKGKGKQIPENLRSDAKGNAVENGQQDGNVEGESKNKPSDKKDVGGNDGKPSGNAEGEKNRGGININTQLDTKNILLSLFDNIGNINYGKLGQLTKEIISGKKRLRSIFTEDWTRTTESQRRTIEATLILEGARRLGKSNLGLSRETQSQ